MLTLFVVVIVALLLILDYAKKRSRFPSIPTMSPLFPVIGNTFLLSGGDLQLKFERFNEKFKVDRMFKGWIGPVMIVGVAHPDLVQRLLSDPSCLEKPFYYEFFAINNGILTAKYDVWKPWRKVLNKTFNKRFLIDSMSAFKKCSQEMVDGMKCCPRGVPVDVLPFTLQCTLKMICATTMGLERSGSKQLYENMEIFLEQVAFRIFNARSYIDALYRRKDHCSQLERARSFCLNYAQEIIEERRATLKNVTTEEDHEFSHKIIIDQVLEMNDQEELSDQILCEQIMTIMMAGSDTVAQTIAHACLFLAIYPDLQEKLYTEITTFLPSETTEITLEILKDLTFLDRFFKETIRIAPTAPIIARTNMAPIELDGNLFPPGTHFILNFFELHRRPDVWGPTDPARFDPDNFSPDRAEGRHPFGFLPFSGGSRNCLGQRYAMVNAKIMLIYIVRNFRLSTDIRYEDVRFRMGITLHLAFKHSIVLEARR